MLHNDLSLYILDICLNSLEANCNNLFISIIDKNNSYEINISDDGNGLDESTLANCLKEGYSTKGKTRGFGLYNLNNFVKLCNGNISIKSKSGIGTIVDFSILKNDTLLPPLKNIKETLYSLMLNENNVDIHFIYKINNKEFKFVLSDLLDEFNIKISDPIFRSWFYNYVDENLQDLNN